MTDQQSPSIRTDGNQTGGQESQADHRDRMERLAKEQSQKVKRADESRGVVIVHTGEGKGKSTAGFGVAIRAAGHGQRVGIVQFIKGTWKTGEQAAFRRFEEITHIVSGDGFTWKTKDKANDIASAERGLRIAEEMIQSGDYDVLILDEINVAMSYGYLNPMDVGRIVMKRPREMSVVLTGRGAPPAIIVIADTVSEHVAVKHAFTAGIRARKGIEF